MRRLPAVAACLLLTACAGASSSPVVATPSASCELRLPAAPAAGPAPMAVLRDVAGGPAEYLLGVPGGRVIKLAFASGFSPPRLAGSSLFFSIRHGQASYIYRGTPGGCASRLAAGTLGEVEDGGRALSALVDSRWVMLDATGRRVTQLTGAAGSWTVDGRLVEPTVAGIDIYDRAGHKRTVAVTGAAPIGSLGSRQELVSTATGIAVMDLDSGVVHPLGGAGQQVLRAATGSPDGTRVAYLDQSGGVKVLEVPTGRVQALTAPALATGFAWSRDSQWVEVQTVYGGAALHLADGRVVDSGSLVVVSW